MPTSSCLARSLEYVYNLYYYSCEKYGKENIDYIRFIKILYNHDRSWLFLTLRPYIFEDYLLFNSAEFIDSIPDGKFNPGKFAKVDRDIVEKLPNDLSLLDKLTYVRSINHIDEIRKYVESKSDNPTDLSNKDNIFVDSVELYKEFRDNHFFFYKKDEYESILKPLRIKNRSNKLKMI